MAKGSIRAAVLMHADHRDGFAAVGFAALTGRTLLAGHVGNNRHLLAFLQRADIFA